MKLTTEQNNAVKLMEKPGVNVFLHGIPGAGKDFTLEFFKKTSNRKGIYLSPTGITASQMNGVTIHSLFGFPTGIANVDLLVAAGLKNKGILNLFDTYVINECSMLPSYLMDAIDKTLRACASGDDKGKVFGGKKFIMSGDFYQQEPVIESKHLYKLLKVKYGGIYCFNAPCWEEAQFVGIELKTAHRQTDNYLLDILNKIRSGTISARELKEFNLRCCKPICEDSNTTILCATNAEVKLHNQRTMDMLSSEEMVFHSEQQGEFQKGKLFPDDNLLLKMGSRVMTLRNDIGAFGRYSYCNGSIGTVLCMHNDCGIPKVYVAFDNEKTVEVQRAVWFNSRYVLKEGDKEENVLYRRIIGVYKQIPLVPAYSLTINKAQGLTIPKVHVNLSHERISGNKIYTALSRVRSVQDLSFSRPLKMRDLKFNYSVKDFYRNINS